MTKRMQHFTPQYRKQVLDRVHAYMAEHRCSKVVALRALKILKSEYYRFQLMSKRSPEKVADVSDRQQNAPEEFPLALIPARPTKAAKPLKPLGRPPGSGKRDEDRDIATQLLEVAIRLLKRT